MSEKGFKMHISLLIYIETTYRETQSAVLGGSTRHHRFFVRLIALIFRLTVDRPSFAFVAAVGFFAHC